MALEDFPVAGVRALCSLLGQGRLKWQLELAFLPPVNWMLLVLRSRSVWVALVLTLCYDFVRGRSEEHLTVEFSQLEHSMVESAKQEHLMVEPSQLEHSTG